MRKWGNHSCGAELWINRMAFGDYPKPSSPTRRAGMIMVGHILPVLGRSMTCPRLMLGSWLLSALLTSSLAIAQPAKPTAPSSPAEQALAAKGLVRVGDCFVTETDRAFPDSLRATRAIQRKHESGQAKRVALQKDIASTTDRMRRMETEYLNRLDKLNATNKNMVSVYNQRVGQVNLVVTQLKATARQLDQKQKDLQAIPDQSGEFIESLEKLQAQMKAISADYEKLAADPEVTSALAQLNKPGSSAVKLGPSETFARELPKIEKLAATIRTMPLDLMIEHGVPQINVKINDKADVQMVVDSGAATLVLDAPSAKEAGLVPTENDPVATFIVADGSQVQAHIMTVESVRVGPFVVEDVLCAIMPASTKGSNLLGGTFLRHFSYKMDLAAQKLHLSQLTGKPEAMEAAATTRGVSKTE
jgi:clan AA aspartic protease (TIGR02281 family)